MAMELVHELSQMKTQPPKGGKGRYFPMRDPKTGEEQWVEMVSDQNDVSPSDYDFEKGKRWAEKERQKLDGQ